MEYENNFELSFMQRTLDLVNEYNGPNEATLLINCLLGLLILPKESLNNSIPSIDFDNLAEWGIQPSSIKALGSCNYGHGHKPNLKQLLARLRNAVAHFKIEPCHQSGVVLGYSFRDRNGFHAEICLKEIREFSFKLATHLKNQ